MAKLHSLIRFKRHELDEKRRILAELNLQLDVLQQRKRKMLDDLQREKNLAAVDIEIARNFGLYLERMRVEQEALDIRIREKMHSVQAATVIVQDAFLDVKKVEITQERRDQEEEDRLGKIETSILNDIGIENFRRKDTQQI
jgi:hypothetical protein